MYQIKKIYLIIILFFCSFSAQAELTSLEVWANEAIVAIYSYNYMNLLEQQKKIAQYFTAKGWMEYSGVFMASKIPEVVKANSYYVSAVGTLPPTITKKGNHWQAEMPLLVVYKNPQYQQKQYLHLTIHFIQVPSGQGVRGLAITSLEAKEMKPACKCDNSESESTSTNGAKSPQDAK